MSYISSVCSQENSYFYFMKLSPLVYLLFFLLLSRFVAGAKLPPGFAEELIVDQLDPARMAIADDGRLFLAEKNGIIKIYKEGSLNPDPFLELVVDNFNERGLTGMVLDPDFDSNGFIYLFYTVLNENVNRVSRFTAGGDYAIPGSEVVLLESETLGGSIHNGGEMVFGPEGKLYIAFGDGSFGHLPQDTSSLFGKILRINSDGSIPADNPFYEDFEGIFRSIYAIGFRNPFTFDIDFNTGKILANDVGNMVWEEINEIVAGKNYGWPLVEGNYESGEVPDNYLDPVFSYPHEDGKCAVIGAAFYNPEESIFPSKYMGKYLFADYCKGFIRTLDPLTYNIVDTFATDIDRPISIKVANNGDVYYIARSGIGDGSQVDNTSSDKGKVYRIYYVGEGIPFISKSPSNQLLSVGEEANFEIVSGGADDLKYQWFKNDVAISNEEQETLKIENVQLVMSGDRFYCQVFNDLDTIKSAEAVLEVTSNNRPQISITMPMNNNSYNAGEVIQFEGNAVDLEDGVIAASKLRWKINFHHDNHTHPFVVDYIGEDGLLTIPQTGEISDNVWYSLSLSTEDGEGLNNSAFVEIFPNKTDFEIRTEPSGILVNIDGQSSITPVLTKSVIGMQRTLVAPRVHYEGNDIYVFDQWDNGHEHPLLVFEVDNSEQKFTAQYRKIDPSNGEGLLGYYFNGINEDEGQALFTRVDTVINFDWGEESPQTPTINSDLFTVKWRGKIKPLFTDNYKFYTSNDDGARLTINDQLVIDDWTNHGLLERSGRIELMADTWYDLELDYFDAYSAAAISLSWSSGLVLKDIVPKEVLFLPDGVDLEGASIVAKVLYDDLNQSKKLKIISNKLQNVQYHIYDVSGKLLFSTETFEILIGENIVDLNTTVAQNQMLILMLIDDNKEFHTVKFWN